MSASRSARLLALFLAGAGTTHFARPGFYDPMVPGRLPGSARTWTYLSGAAEIAVGASVFNPPTRRLGARLAALLFIAVFPANVKMVGDARSTPERLALLARLPLQVPLVRWALSVAR